ncbi:hypothetical protein EUX98_g6821 [Antrodiella citrinella]|uniref:Peptidase S28 n=1 Tax=Antrodiella citrinella TaxID=2447956 RepID=A0A4S4MQ25_9APHY|nr:hypothetical protein EUX98_g6821 [Antrodiella citrinella]
MGYTLAATIVATIALASNLQLTDAVAPHLTAQSIKLQRLLAPEPSAVETLASEAASPFPQFNFTQPLDHFTDTGHTFEQRYWLSTRHFNPNSTGVVPVFVLDGGETSGTDRLPYLDTGIVDILTEATGGIGIVLEHRYYGASVPVQNFTTDSLRWLNNDQAAADSANFLANVKFPGIDRDLTAPNTPWIYYGGSYAGARSAHMRVLYPDLVYGAIASSGVTFATITDWQYYDIIRQFGPPACVQQLETTVNEVDALLAKGGSARQAIRETFGLGNLTHDQDFEPLGAWQNRNWDPAVNDNTFFDFCDALGTPNSTQVEIAKGVKVNAAVINYAVYVNQVAPPANVPAIISRLITVDYEKLICEFAFPPGEFFTVPALPDIEAVNKLGGLNIAADRLAIIDGQGIYAFNLLEVFD